MTEIVYMKFGSHLYGTDTPESDLDFKGVFMPSREDILLGRIPKTLKESTGDDRSKNQAGDVDKEMFSLHYFLRLACEGQTVTFDMLHAPDSMILHKSPIWDRIIESRDRFYTKNLTAFVGYCRRQAAKYGVKGSRLDAARKVAEVFRRNKDAKILDLWDSLPSGEHIHKLPPTEDDKNQQRIYQVCGKRLLESARCGHALDALDKFVEQYGHRAELAARNEGIDWKAISHALRAAYQVKDILTRGTIEFPLREATYLKEVKAGQRDYLGEVSPLLEGLMDQVEALKEESDLPEKVNHRFWDRFLLNEVAGYLGC